MKTMEDLLNDLQRATNEVLKEYHHKNGFKEEQIYQALKDFSGVCAIKAANSIVCTDNAKQILARLDCLEAIKNQAGAYIMKETLGEVIEKAIEGINQEEEVSINVNLH